MKRLLFLAHRLPWPPDKGERVRALKELEALAQHFAVTLAALRHGPADAGARAALEPLCEQVLVEPAGGFAGLCRGAVRLATGRSVTEGFFHSRRLAAQVDRLSADRPFDLAFGYSSGMLPLLLRARARRRVMDLVDVDSAKWARYAETAHVPVSWLYGLEARAVRRLERLAVDRCDAVLLVSPAEVEALEIDSPRVTAVVNGVDTAAFAPPAGPQPAAEPPVLVFTGTMDYRPNVDGVTWFVRDVWPRLRGRWSDIHLEIVGRDPVAAVRRLASEPGVTVTGGVPEVQPYLHRATMAVAPLRIARGIQNKVLEAMAAGLPVVATSAALEGLELNIGAECLVANTPAEWEAAVGDLLSETARRQQMAAAARRRVVADYGWSARLAPLVDLCRRLVADEAPAAGDEPNAAAERTDG